MANRRDEAKSPLKKKDASTPAKTAAARKGAAGKAAAAPTKAPPETAGAPAPREGAPANPKGLLHAGLKALGNVRDDVVMRQNNIIDSLLGTAPKAAGSPQEKGGVLPRALSGLDPFGIRKFEDVFDQRVATALQHLGIPSPEEFQALREEVKLLREQLQQAQQQPAAAPRRKR